MARPPVVGASAIAGTPVAPSEAGTPVAPTEAVAPSEAVAPVTPSEAGAPAGPPSAPQSPSGQDQSAGDPEQGALAGGKPARPLWRGPLLPLGGVIVAGVVIAIVVVSTGTKKQPTKKVASPAATTTTTTTVKPIAMTTFTDAADGFSISYPASWQRIPDPQRPLVVEDGNSNTAFQVQVYRTDQPITSATSVASIKKFTDLIFGAAQTKIIAESSITVNQMPGYYYLAVYKQGNQIGANTVEFLFQGRKMAIITFQAFPYTHLTVGLGKLFDQILYSYHSNPDVLGPPLPPPTTATTTRPRATSKTSKG